MAKLLGAATARADSEPLGVLVIGAGDLGSRHALHWREAGARVAVICDPWQERAVPLAAQLGAECAVDPAPYLQRDDIQIVSVCTPTFLHEQYTVMSLEAGKHVLCEKPAALTLSAALRMKEAARANKRELRIGLMRRFDPAQVELARLHSSLGGPTLAQASMVAGIRPKRFMHDPHGNGGPVIDMCCHLFDLWSTLFGAEPHTVTAHGYTFAAHAPELADLAEKAVDSVQFTLNYPGGQVGQVQVSWGLPSGVEHLERHSYAGPGGLMVVDWNRQVELRSGAQAVTWLAPEVNAWREQIAQFHRELTASAPRQVASIDDGIAALRVSLAVLRSVAEGRPVSLSEEFDGAPINAKASGVEGVKP